MQLIGWFNKSFIKAGLIETRFGRILRDSFKNRSDGDYVPFMEFNKIDVVDMLADMKEFILMINRFIANKL